MNNFLSSSYSITRIQNMIESKSDLEWELFAPKLCNNNDNIEIIYDYTSTEHKYENITFILRKLYYNLKSQIKSQNINNTNLYTTIIESIIYEKNCLKLISNSFCLNFLLLIYIDNMRFERLLNKEIKTDKLRKIISLHPKKVEFVQEILKNEEFEKESDKLQIELVNDKEDNNQKENISINIQNLICEDATFCTLPFNWKTNEM